MFPNFVSKFLTAQITSKYCCLKYFILIYLLFLYFFLTQQSIIEFAFKAFIFIETDSLKFILRTLSINFDFDFNLNFHLFFVMNFHFFTTALCTKRNPKNHSTHFPTFLLNQFLFQNY